MKQFLAYDIEVAPNYMLVGFSTLDGKVHQFEAFGKKATLTKTNKIKRLMRKHTLIGFNNKNYDDVILQLMLGGATCRDIYTASATIIEDQVSRWNAYKMFRVEELESVDLIEVAPGQASLKLYGGRLHSKKLQDLPYNPHDKLTRKQADEVALYNINDLITTIDLYNGLKPRVDLRIKMSEQYGVDLRSKSDAQIAEAIFKHELNKERINTKRTSTVKSIQYKATDRINFSDPQLTKLVQRIEDTTIAIGKSGSPMMPEWLKSEVITIGETNYNIGMGGLHSMEKQLIVKPGKGETLANLDVASMYPALIITLGLYPRHLTSKFLDIYNQIKVTRLAAKAEGDDDVNLALKIVLNGSYGKFGSNYSFLYSPHLMLSTTFTGQLYMLMLIERLEAAGFRVVSSNTDGVEFIYPTKKKKKLDRIVKQWENETKMDMEYGEYKALYARDVNNYVAVYDGYTKAVGAYADPTTPKNFLTKNSEYPIVFEAIRTFLLNGKPMIDTLKECKDVSQFCTSRQVTGGALYTSAQFTNTDEYNNYVQGNLKQNKALEKRNDDHHKDQALASDDGDYLGKVVRWYYSTKGKPIFYKKSGNKVPKSDGAAPMMQLTKKIPKDLDYDRYLELCEKHLKDLGA